ncbi:MAG: hypothetical protein BGO25_03155 [Acidobacteriales bacterium 59-55]|nr:hypothetical protein [Terriglobales bacterium]OJV40161.1 MAG: hypothetical protein BGO25_03155 [Acidobacteriales bacterium 59-55]
MSISAAVAELNKEIVVLDKIITEAERTKARLVTHRDALLKEDRGGGGVAVKRGKPGRKSGRPANKAKPVKKTASVKKAAGAKRAIYEKKTVAPRKRTMSPEARKRIADAQKKRWAKQKQTAKSE